jgi:signal transduction histidine kinase
MRRRQDGIENDESAAPVQGGPPQEEDSGSIELTPELRSKLLDPVRWGTILGLYARTTTLAVALIDPDGQLVGRCHNPQPIWQLAREARPNSTDGCLFCLETNAICSAAAEALRTGSLTLAHDQAGFAHVALPLTLGNQHLGTLLAGQILDRYPQPLPLQRVARDFGLPPQRLWDLSRQRAPMSRANLTVFGELLWTLGQTFLRDRYGAVLRKLSDTLLRRLNLHLNFSYAASHDLQEPLRTVKLYTQMLAREYEGKLDSQADQFISGAIEGTQRIETLLRDLREYWLVNEPMEKCIPVDSALVLQNTLKALQVPIEESGTSVTYGPLPTVIAEEVSLAMLFQNLVGNAIKYRHQGKPPIIHISAQKKADEWCFSVKDNGIGIKTEYLEEIFAPFKRLHGKNYPGSGIGLALCEKIVERYTGRLWVESTYGEGSTFYFTIPARGGAVL